MRRARNVMSRSLAFSSGVHARSLGSHSDSTGVERSTDRVRAWRKRVLLRRGAWMHAVMGANRKSCSLAMLDEEGVVVSWYARGDVNGRLSDHVVDRHVSQFYVIDDIARRQPLRDLRAAIAAGKSTRQGWYLSADGTAFWGKSVIEAVTRRDGRLRGFSYVTCRSGRPPRNLPIARCPPAREENSGPHAGAHGVVKIPAWDRMARSRSATRQRRLFRFAGLMRDNRGV